MALNCNRCGHTLRQPQPGDIVRVKGTQTLGVIPNESVRKDMSSFVLYIGLANGRATYRLPEDLEFVHGVIRVQRTEAL